MLCLSKKHVFLSFNPFENAIRHPLFSRKHLRQSTQAENVRLPAWKSFFQKYLNRTAAHLLTEERAIDEGLAHGWKLKIWIRMKLGKV